MGGQASNQRVHVTGSPPVTEKQAALDQRRWKSAIAAERPGELRPEPHRSGLETIRIIRLVPSREGCRLPLNEGLLPAKQLAQMSGDGPPPSLQPHYRAFVATTRQSAPLRRVGTFGLALEPLAPFPLASPARFSRSVPKPSRGSCRLHAGCRSVGIRASPEVIPKVVPTPGFDIA